MRGDCEVAISLQTTECVINPPPSLASFVFRVFVIEAVRHDDNGTPQAFNVPVRLEESRPALSPIQLGSSELRLAKSHYVREGLPRRSATREGARGLTGRSL